MSRLSKNDYKEILLYYKQPIPKTYNALKANAEKILGEKLCRCIKKVDTKNEKRSIGICTRTIFNRKGYTRNKFKCKGKPTVLFSKTVKNRK